MWGNCKGKKSFRHGMGRIFGFVRSRTRILLRAAPFLFGIRTKSGA